MFVAMRKGQLLSSTVRRQCMILSQRKPPPVTEIILGVKMLRWPYYNLQIGGVAYEEHLILKIFNSNVKSVLLYESERWRMVQSD